MTVAFEGKPTELLTAPEQKSSATEQSQRQYRRFRHKSNLKAGMKVRGS